MTSLIKEKSEKRKLPDKQKCSSYVFSSFHSTFFPATSIYFLLKPSLWFSIFKA
jgi:hypothetical protein